MTLFTYFSLCLREVFCTTLLLFHYLRFSSLIVIVFPCVKAPTHPRGKRNSLPTRRATRLVTRGTARTTVRRDVPIASERVSVRKVCEETRRAGSIHEIPLPEPVPVTVCVCVGCFC